MKKKFIEWDLPLKEISEESARERSIRHGHPSTLHIWWARKPLGSSRATNFASLIDLPESSEKRNEIKELIKDITPWEAVKNGNSEAVKKAREIVLNQFEDPPKVLDPFAGGGSIPLEGSRVGCDVYASDYNPVAVFIEKATIEWPQKYGIDIEIPLEKALESELDASDYTSKQIEKYDNTQKKDKESKIEVDLLSHLVQKYANRVLKDTKEEIGQFYPKESSKGLIGEGTPKNDEGWIPVCYVWSRTIPCQNPNCNAQIPLINNFFLAKKKNIDIAFKPIVDDKKEKVTFEIIKGNELQKAIKNGFDPGKGTVSRANAECLVCGQVTEAKFTKKLAKEGKMEDRMIAVVFRHPNETGKRYRIATEDDIKTYKKAKKYLKNKLNDLNWIETPIPKEKMPPTDTYGIDVQRYTENEEWGELFNDRQLLSMLVFIEKIKETYSLIKKDCSNYISGDLIQNKEKFSKAVIGYLGIIHSNLVDFNSKLCVLNSTGGRGVAHTFGRQALRIAWDYAETNVFNPVGASWESCTKNNLKVIRKLTNFSAEPGNVSLNSAQDISNERSFDAIFTDPPYYDNVPYSDLSDFFYVWLKRSVGNFFPNLFSTPLTPKSKEAIADPARQENAEKFFEKILSKSFSKMYKLLKPNGIATIIYAHKTTEGWETMLNSLVNSGFHVTASWPIHTEMKSRLRGAHSAALASSIYMICRKTEREKLGFWKDIKPQIKERVEKKLHQFWNKNIVGGDFFISAIGPGMEIYSQYENVERYSGEEVTTLDLLEYIRSITTDFVVNNLLKDASPTEVDSASQFYLAYRWTYLDNKVEFDDARRIASGMGIELNNFSGKNGFVKQARKYTSVLGPQDREEVEKINNMVDVMHKCVLLWDEGKQDEIKQLLSDTGYGEKPAFWQFCQAAAETLLNGNKEKQLLEGFLTGKDKYSKSSKDDEQKGLDQFGGD